MTRGAGGLGLDGCPGGWVAVHVVGDEVAGAAVVGTIAEACEVFPPATVGIDIPIGLDDAPPRAADTAARRLLGRAAPSVFNAPPRCVVDAYTAGEVTDHGAATALARRVTGQGMSQQAWGLVGKVAEADAFAADAALGVVEVHPEVQFRLLAGAPLARKTSWAGAEARRRLLAEQGLVPPAGLPGGERAAPHDVLDATVVAWAAAGLAAGKALRAFPDDPPTDPRGRPVAIWARPPATGAVRRR